MAAKKDFFISRNKADAAWAKWIAWQLDEAGYTTVLQDWDFRPGSDFIEEMDLAAKESERTIAVLSPDFLTSKYTKAEWHAAFMKGALLPVRVREVNLDGLLGPVVYIDLVGLEADAAKDALLAGVKRGRVKPKGEPALPKAAGPPSPGPRFPGALPPTWNVPHLRNPNFTGRDDLLAQLRDKLTSGEHAAITQAISGLGGVGKTQLATEYCYRHASDYERVWCVRSEEPAKLAADYANLALELDLPQAKEVDQRLVIEAVRRWLDQNGGWLIVFDNVPGPEQVRDYLPRGASGHVIVTSRNPNWGAIASALTVVIWDRDDSVEFLLKRTEQDDEEAADKLADALGGLPLALEQAAAYMKESACSLSRYVELFRERQPELMERGKPPEGYEHTVATTWDLSFEQVEKESGAAADLLNLCAFLAPDDIPLDIIREGAEHLPEGLANAAQDDLAWNDAITALRRYSLVEVSGESLSLHRLVQAAARDRLAEDAKRTWAEAAVRLINGAFPDGIQTDLATWPVCSRLLPHALAAAADAVALNVAAKATNRLFNVVGHFLRVRGQFADAKAAYEGALRIAESYYGSDHTDTAANLSNLSGVLKELGDLPRARQHIERALGIFERAYGPDDPNVATLVNNLGSALRSQGDLEGARAHFERALRIDEAFYGLNHPTVAIPVNNLGGVQQELGDLTGPRANFERALRIKEAAYGADHPEVAPALNNLGGVLLELGDLAGARAHGQRALEIYRRFLGDGHPSTVKVRNNLDALQE